MNFKYDRQMGQNIRTIREEQSLTQEQLAARLQTQGCDITRSALAKIEAGQRHIYSHEIKAIKSVLDVEYDELFI